MNGLYQDYQQEFRDGFQLYESDEYLKCINDDSFFTDVDSGSSTTSTGEIEELFPLVDIMDQPFPIDQLDRNEKIVVKREVIQPPPQQHRIQKPSVSSNHYSFNQSNQGRMTRNNNKMSPSTVMIKKEQVTPPPPPTSTESVPKRSPSPTPTPKKKKKRAPPRSRPSKARRTGRKRKRQTTKKSEKDMDKDELRRLKNRESARASRERRKKYISDLETSNQTLVKSNTTLFTENRGLLDENEKLRRLVDQLLEKKREENGGSIPQKYIQSKPESLEPVKKRRKLYFSEVNPQLFPLTTEVLPTPQDQPKGRGRPIQQPPSELSNHPQKRYVPFTFNPFSSLFWNTVVPTKHLNAMNAKKAMLVFMVVLVIAFFLTIPRKDDYLLNQFIKSTADGLSNSENHLNSISSPPNIISSSGSSSISSLQNRGRVSRASSSSSLYSRRRLLSMDDNVMVDEDGGGGDLSALTFDDKIQLLFNEFREKLDVVLGDSGGGNEQELSVQDIYELLNLRIDKDQNYIVMELPNREESDIVRDGNGMIIEKPVLRTNGGSGLGKSKKGGSEKQTLKHVTKDLLMDLCALIREKEGVNN